MSAYVSYNLTAADRNGVVVGTFPVRAVCMPDRDSALDLAREQYGDIVTAVTCARSIPARIGKVTPAAAREHRTTVSARVKVLG